MRNFCLPCLVIATMFAAARGPLDALPQNVPDLDAIPQLRLVQELRVGSSSDPTVGFTRIGCQSDVTRGFPNTGCVSVDPQGQLYVFESQERKIRVYGNTGQLVRTIGRAGNGPGEFEGYAPATQIGVKGDTVWAVEEISPQTRISLFRRRDGAFISAVTIPRPKVRGRGVDSLILMPAAMRADGNFISANYIRSISRGAGPTGLIAADRLPIPRLLFGATGRVIDTLVWLHEAPLTPSPPAPSVTIGNSRFTAPRPTSDADITVLFIDGSFVVTRVTPTAANPATISVKRASIRGESVYSRSYRYTPRRFSPALLDSLALASLRRPFAAAAGGGPANAGAIVAQRPAPDTSARARAAIRGAMTFPPFQPPVQGVFVAADAALWMRRDVTAGPTQRWDIIDPQGNPRGRVNLPLTARPVWSSGNTVWVVHLDEDDVPWLIRYRVGS